MEVEGDNMSLSNAIAATQLSDSTPSIKHFVDLIYDVEPSSIDMDNLKAIIRDKAWQELPEALTLKERPTFSCLSQFCLLPQTNGKLCVLKHYYVKSDKVKGAYVAKLVRGQGKEIAWTSLNKQQARRGFQWMLECLGGHQFREDEQDAGWDFIISNGERDKENLKQMRWIHRHIQKEGSPSHGWNEKLVQRALDCLANDGCLAKLSDRYDLTIQAIQPEILTILEDLLPHLRGHSLWLLGESGVGKTPLARILSMMFSRYHGGNGQFRSAPEFDFFRGIFFDKATPAIFDDGEIGNETIKKKKAFSDVGDSETILKERWTAAKFVMHQLRIVVDNQYNPEGQEGDVDGVFSAEVSHESFMKLVRPAVGYIANADAMAILKRAAFIVFAEKYIYFRPPTEKHVKVQRVFWTNSDSKDILLPDCKPTLKNWKNGGPQPDTYSASVAWETEWLKELFRRHDHPVRPASPACPATPLTSTPGLDALLRADGALPAAPASSRPASSSLSIPHPAPALLVGVPKLEPAEHPDAHAWLATATRGDPVDVGTDRASAGWTVKEEPSLKFQSLAFTSSEPIVLDTPSPPPHKRQRRTEDIPNPDTLPGLHPPSDDEDPEIMIEQEIQDTHLDLYDSFCHSSTFPPHKRQQVKTLVLDGNQKLKMQCDMAPMKRAGRPRKSEHTTGHYTNGWMLACDPKSGRIISLQVMHEPEGNEVATLAVENVIWLYPKLDCLVYDRACAFKSCGESNEALNQIGYYVVDGFHSHGYRKKLEKRIHKENTSICEQVFSWFRNFSPIINEMRAHRHKFFLLLLSKRHNESIEAGNIRYLHPTRLPNLFKNAKSVSYLCGKKSNTKNAIGKPSSGNKMVMKGKSMKTKSMKYKK
ncbi:Uncharacterized protein SCF082_LOCUS43283 [Durusdinium trenchii]|uniref:Uncharacterized protein n=2 Tax=Durusdinium trenchii TaxID=1381693 RepID=A0ABP0QXU6_9DINO